MTIFLGSFSVMPAVGYSVLRGQYNCLLALPEATILVGISSPYQATPCTVYGYLLYEVAQRLQAFGTGTETGAETGTGVMAAQMPAPTPYRSWLL